MSNFTVISDDDATELNKLREFYKEICNLTVNHDTIENGLEGIAVVYPNKLGIALSKVNLDWYKISE